MIFVQIGVSITPGWTVLIRIPSPAAAHSIAAGGSVLPHLRALPITLISQPSSQEMTLNMGKPGSSRTSDQQHATRFEIPHPRRSPRPAAGGPRHRVTL
jgi:hypothetical protein